jgi:putative ABC transport system substrate-binding protein
MMRRREFIAGLGSATTWPVVVRAQRQQLPVVGWLSARPLDSDTELLAAFRDGLAEQGFVEGRNVVIEYRHAENRYDRLPALAADLVRQRVAVIATNSGTTSVRAAREATSAIPIVFVVGVDPVQSGFVGSLSRPGGNLTGATLLFDDMGAKRLQILHELIPSANSIAVLTNPTNAGTASQLKELTDAAPLLGIRLLVVEASTEREFDAAFATLIHERAAGVVVFGDPLFASHRDRLIALTSRHAVPAIYQAREDTAAGGLMSYGGFIQDATRIIGGYAGRILKGEKPADLPVQQVTKVQLVINMKTAKALGITVPLSLLGRADEVIE